MGQSYYFIFVFIIASIFAQNEEDTISQKKELIRQKRKELGELSKVTTSHCRSYFHISDEIKIIEKSGTELEKIACTLSFTKLDDDTTRKLENYLVILLHSQLIITDEITMDENYYHEETKKNRENIKKYTKKISELKEILISLAKMYKKNKGKEDNKLTKREFLRAYNSYRITQRYLTIEEENLTRNIQVQNSASNFLFLLTRCSKQLQIVKMLLRECEKKEHLLKHINLCLLYTEQMIRDHF